MTRALWLFANMLLVFVALGAGWFAINAPQIARPVLAPLGQVELTPEAPPAPPGPLLMSTTDMVEVLNKRPLFTRPESPDASPPPPVLALEGGAVANASELAPTALAPDGDAALDSAPLRDVRAESPIARTMLDSLPAPLKNAPQIGEERRAPVDGLSAALSTPSPEVKQFFSWRSMNYNARDSDQQPPAAASSGLETQAPATIASGAMEAAPLPDSIDEPPVETAAAPEEQPGEPGGETEPPAEVASQEAAPSEMAVAVEADQAQGSDSSPEVSEQAADVSGQNVGEQDVSEIAASTETLTTASEAEASEQEMAVVEDDASGAEDEAEAELAVGPPAPASARRPTQRAAAPLPPQRSGAAGSSIYDAFDQTVSLSGDEAASVDELGSAEGEEIADFANLSAPRPSARPSPEDMATRRVEAAATTRIDAAAPPEGGMILLGVFNGRGNERALVRTSSGSQRVVVGDEIDGWRVTAINNSSVQLRRASNVRMLRMP